MTLHARWGIILALWLLAGLAQAGTKHYYYTDAQGTVLAKADAQGNIVATYDYAPYGKQVLGTTPSGPTGYTGHVNDAESGLVYMQARYYDPVVGRFLSPDPAGRKTGFNDYAYVGNNPINKTDPTGMF
ncbi:MAG: RHS repeat-associated core domain-containing protein [Rhodanobacter sp.]